MSVFSDAQSTLLACAVASGNGLTVLYTPAAGGSSFAVTGIWDTSDRARGAGQDRFAGRLWIPVQDEFVPLKGDTFLIGSITYRVVNFPQDDADGAGGYFLYVRRT